jgi:hypothetical protein
LARELGGGRSRACRSQNRYAARQGLRGWQRMRKSTAWGPLRTSRCSPIGACAAAAVGIVFVLDDKVAAGIVLLGLAVLAVVAQWRKARDRRSGRYLARRLEALVFFGALATAGIVIVVLAAAGTLREPGFYATVGAIITVASCYVLMSGMKRRR